MSLRSAFTTVRHFTSLVRTMNLPPRVHHTTPLMEPTTKQSFVSIKDAKIHHDPEKCRFYLPLDENSEAVLDYRRDGNTLDMYHTEVPPQYREHGIAAQLAQHAFDYAVQNNLKMRLTCSYLRETFLPQHQDPRYKELVVD